MEKIEYERLNKREQSHWWNIGRQKILEFVLEKETHKNRNLIMLDVGCGAGGNIVFLKKFGTVSGFDISPEAMRFSKDKGFKELISGSAEKMLIEDGSYDIVSALDVVEHVRDDKKALSEIFRILKNEGTLLLTVPAHKWLWSRHDEALHHFRRYSNKELRNRILEAGFEIKKQTHFVIPAIPFLLLKKLIRRMKKIFGRNEVVDTYDEDLKPFMNSALIYWLSFEKFLIKYINIPFGSSLLVVAKKISKEV